MGEEAIYIDPLRQDVDSNGQAVVGSYTVIGGQINNASGGGGAQRFADWGATSQSSSAVGMTLPYESVITGYAAAYNHQSTAFNAGGAESLTIELGTIGAGLPSSSANFVPFAGTAIVWGSPKSGTHPQGSVSGLNILLAAGSRLAVRSQEVGSVVPTSADISIGVVVRVRVE